MQRNFQASSPALAGCDTLVALGEAARRGVAIFGKNSDRPPGEAQAPVIVDRALHAPGDRVRCQYVEIPQVRETARVLGSRPTWLWGFEMGLNEHGVAIGNETVFAHEAPAATGLIGMDLVRLGLERAASAEQAVSVLIELIETHGQGGSGFRDLEWPYNNSFLVADPDEAWILEAAGRQWATRRCAATDSISNQVSIGADWERLGATVIERARALGLETSEPFDFARAYRDTTTIPPQLSEGRLRRSRALLAEGRGRHTVETLQAILRDHDASGGPRFVAGATPDEERFYTLCMHQGPSRTAASMVIELERGAGVERVAWLALGRPCTSAFFPVFFAGELPDELVRAGEQDGAGEGLWWVFERLAEQAERSPEAADAIGARFAELERSLAEEASRFAADAAGCTPSELAERATAANRAVFARVDATARRLAQRCAELVAGA
ncbi:MAG TPA: C69 family dipeptidase [Candidatus Binatia bacterium]